jgi:hypothetical protein
LKELEPVDLFDSGIFLKNYGSGCPLKNSKNHQTIVSNKTKEPPLPKAVKYPLSAVYISSTSLGTQVDRRLVGTEVVTQHLKVSD